jgi:RNA polymerase sigma-70 factor (ECF subfamily)
LLEDQDRASWDGLQIEEGLARVERALRMGPPTPYAVQAAIAALHAQAPVAAATDWPQIALLYAELSRLLPTPVVELNRAVAVAMAEGPAKGLELLARLGEEQEMRSYHLYFAARADLSRRAGQLAAARKDYARALELVRTAPERRYLEKRLFELSRIEGDPTLHG